MTGGLVTHKQEVLPAQGNSSKGGLGPVRIGRTKQRTRGGRRVSGEATWAGSGRACANREGSMLIVWSFWGAWKGIGVAGAVGRGGSGGGHPWGTCEGGVPGMGVHGGVKSAEAVGGAQVQQSEKGSGPARGEAGVGTVAGRP